MLILNNMESNKESRWSKAKNYLFYWQNGKTIFCLNTKTLNPVKVTNPEMFYSPVENWITEEEAKKILLDLFWKKYPNGKFKVLNDKNSGTAFVSNVNQVIYIRNNYVFINHFPFLNLTTGEWAGGVEDEKENHVRTQFEAALEPVENWIKEKLKHRIPKDDNLSIGMCAALILQYQSEPQQSEEVMSAEGLNYNNCLAIIQGAIEKPNMYQRALALNELELLEMYAKLYLQKTKE